MSIYPALALRNARQYAAVLADGALCEQFVDCKIIVAGDINVECGP